MTGGWFSERGGLAGTVAVITGGAGGLGQAIATDLAANGVRIAVLDIDAEAAGGLRDELASRGAAAIVHTGDARDPVAPDYVPTPNLAKLATAGDGGMSTPAGQRVAIPMGRAGLPADISGCVVFLASKLSAFVTGTTLHPDGGTFASAGWFNWPGSGWANHVPSSVLEKSGLDPLA